MHFEHLHFTALGLYDNCVNMELKLVVVLGTEVVEWENAERHAHRLYFDKQVEVEERFLHISLSLARPHVSVVKVHSADLGGRIT